MIYYRSRYVHLLWRCIMKSIIYFIRIIESFMFKLKKDSVSAYAAQAAFFIILSVFPFFMFLLTLIHYLPLTEQDLINAVLEIAPASIAPFINNIINEIYTSSTTTLLSITGITAIWGASKAFYALIYGLNAVYGILETRNYVVLRLIATLYTLVFGILLLITLSILGFGNSIALAIQSRIPALSEIALLVISIRATTALCILILYFLALYIVIPNRKSNILQELPGAVVTAGGWIGFTYLYSFYIDHMSNFTNTYGSLTAIVLLMLWLYACMYMLLIGGEVNEWIQKRKMEMSQESSS